MNNNELDFRKVLAKILSKGGDYADIFIERSAAAAVQIEGDRVEKAQVGMDSGAGLRLLADGKTFYAYTNEIEEKRLLELAGNLAGAPAGGKIKDIAALSRRAGKPHLEIQTAPAGVSLEKKVEIAQRANIAARKMDKRIRQVRVNFGDSQRHITIANSDGAFTEETRTQLVFLVHVVAVDGDVVQTGYEPVGGTVGMELLDANPPEEIAARAVKRALLMLEAPPAPPGKMAVVLSSEAGGTMIHEAVGHGLEADLADEGLSIYTGKIGQNIASPLITVVDDSTLSGARGAFAFDDEGTPSQRTVLIDRGKLVSYMHSRLTSMKAGAKSTGNGRRENYRHRPIVRMTNTMILPGSQNADEIIRSVAKGLLVRKMGGGQVNTVNGDFVFEISEGYLIENGRQGPPVRNATLIGNGRNILESIDMVGSDLGFAIGTCGKDNQGAPVSDAQPTLRIPEITVGGKT